MILIIIIIILIIIIIIIIVVFIFMTIGALRFKLALKWCSGCWTGI